MAISPQQAVTLSTAAYQSFRTFVGRGAKVFAPIMAVCGAVSDLASTLGKFSLFLFLFALIMALVSGPLWFLHYRRRYHAAMADGSINAQELASFHERNVWSVLFAFSIVATLMMGGFVLAEKLSGDGDKGVIATVVPGMDKVQEALFRVEKKVAEVKADTTAIRTDTSAIRADASATRQDTAATRQETAEVHQETTKIAATVEEIAKRFDSLSSTGGLIPGAKTPEEHYHNARIQELGGNFSAARKEYADYLTANLETLDPWQSYATMLKAQEGRAGAAETIHYFGDKLQPSTVSYQTTLALLEEGNARLTKLQALAADHPEYGPLSWLISQEYSEVRRGEQTFADQKNEKEWLEKFRAAQADGKVERFFLDKKEAQKWIETADARWAKLSSTAARVLENPVSLTLQQSNQSTAITFILSDFKAKELYYKLDGRGDFQSTGHLPMNNPQTGLPMINPRVEVGALTSGAHKVEVKYTDKNDQTNGPFTLNFTTAEAALAQGKMTVNALQGSWVTLRDFNGQVLVYFTTLMSYRPVIKEVRYSINNENVDRPFKFKPTEKMFEAGSDLYISAPRDTQYVAVQVTFRDGTTSAVQKVYRGK